MDTEKIEKAYLGSYITNDSAARKMCEQRLLFGFIGKNEVDLKYVKLFCPTCKFEHEFKREFCSDDVDASYNNGFHSHGCNQHKVE